MTAVGLGVSAASPAVASGGPAFELDLHHHPTRVPPGGTGELWIEVSNIGDAATAGEVTLSLSLPPSLTLLSTRSGGTPAGWSCIGEEGDREVRCATSAAIPRHSRAPLLIATVKAAAGGSGERFAAAAVEGGGAERSTAAEMITLSSDPATFGIVPGSFGTDVFAAGGRIPVREAGSHPERLQLAFDLDTLSRSSQSAGYDIDAVGSLRNFALALPPGFVGNPAAAVECPAIQFLAGACARASQVGRVDLVTGPSPSTGFPGLHSAPVYELQPARGTLIDLGFAVAGNPVHVRFGLDPSNDYSVVAEARDLNESESLLYLKMTLWGVPADHSHDSERCGLPDTSGECAAKAEAAPFLTMPSDCQANNQVRLDGFESWQEGGRFAPDLTYDLGAVTDCARLHFEPSLRVGSTVPRASSPTGIDLKVVVPQDEDPYATAVPPVKSIELALPEGVRVSPAGVDGTVGCAEDEIALGTDQPVGCPDSSRLGTAELRTPLLAEPLRGYIYLATPNHNPSNSLFAVYVVLSDQEDRGVMLKLPGSLDLDPATGRIAAVFRNLPQLPFEELDLRFRSGPRAPLAASPDCGSQQVSAQIASWARPEEAVPVGDSYGVAAGPGGVSCAQFAGAFSPMLSAGTIDPTAAMTTPLVFKLSRSESEQPLRRFSATLPPGVVAAVAGIPSCPGAPCSADSRLGTARVSVGVGPDPLTLSGSVYLGGSYGGSPYSLVVSVPVLVGPFDLGALSLRVRVDVDPDTAQLRFTGDPLPTILAGVPVDVRGLSILLDRPGLIRNPTSCRKLEVSAQAASVGGLTAHLSDRFRVGGCGALRFEPRLSVYLRGGLQQNGHPALRVLLEPGAADAGVAGARIVLPAEELLDLRRLRALCPRQAPANCPSRSRIGSAQVSTPLLPTPIQGPVYLRESKAGLPGIVADLSGGGLHIRLHGDTAAVGGRLQVRLRGLPDIPIDRAALVLSGGRRGILVNSERLCGSVQHAAAVIAAQNGKVLRLRPRLRLRGRC